jgi:hypothetical protein
MSRSNGPVGHPGGQNPPARQPVQQDPYAQFLQPRPAQGPAQGQGTAQQPPQGWPQQVNGPQGQDPMQNGYYPPHGQGAEQGYGQPQARPYDPAQQAYIPQPVQQDPRTQTPRSQPVAPGAYAQPQQQPQLSSLQRVQQQAPQPQVPGYGLNQPDPSRYDLSQYPSHQGQPAAIQPGHSFPGLAAAQAQRVPAVLAPQGQDWQPPQQAPRTGAPAQAYPIEPQFSNHAAHAPDPYAQQRQARNQPSLGIPPPNDQHGYDDGHAGDEHHDEEYEDELEERPSGRGRKSLMLVAGLVGAIGIGAGCAYAYKTYFSPANGKPPLLKADSGPSKSKPAIPGGKEFANADRKITARLGEDGGSAGSSATEDSTSEVGGPRKVQIIPITPNGAGGATAQVAPPAGRPAQPTVVVPGMAVEFGNPPGRPPGPPQAPQVVQTVPTSPPGAQMAPPAQTAPARVAVAQIPPPAAAKAAAPAVTADAATAPPKKTVVAKAAAPKSSDAFSPGASPSGVGAANVAPVSGGTSGFVAVVASQGSAKEAMTAYADLKQKYADVLGDKPADIREAVVNGKTWHRAVVGPPGSRASVENLCSQLKAAGFLGCWPSTY